MLRDPGGRAHRPRHARRLGVGLLATGYVAILSFEIFLAGSHSLKEKRMVVRSVRQQLTNRLGCTVAEVDHHDVWQRARLTLACAAREAQEAERLLDEAERWLVGNGHEVIAAERGLVTLDDA